MINESCGIGLSTSWGKLFGSPALGAQGEPSNREAVASDLRRVLRDADVHGAIIRGEHGSGKREAIEKAILAESYGGSIYRIAGTRYGRGLDYGALHFLLVDIQEEQISSPLMVFNALRFRFDGESVRPLFVIENLAFLDPWSTTVLAQLVQAGLIKMIIIDDLQFKIPEDVLCLVRTGALELAVMLPLSMADVEEHIKSSTGIDPSPLATARLWIYSEGNVAWLDALLHEGLEQGILKHIRDSLVISSDHFSVGRMMQAVAGSKLERLSPAQRNVLELVAHGRMLDYRFLDAFPTAEIDMLHEDGLLEVVYTPHGMVRLSSLVLGDCLRAMTTEARRREIDRELAAAMHPGEDPQESGTSDQMGQLRRTFERLPVELAHSRWSRQALGAVTRARIRSYGDLSTQPGTHKESGGTTDDVLGLLDLELRLALQAGEAALAESLIGVLEPMQIGFRVQHPETHQLHLAAATLLGALARGNRETDAAVLGHWLAEACLQRGLQGADHEPEPCLAHTVRALLNACLTLGEWDCCRELTTLVLEGRIREPHLIVYAGIIRTILLVASGDLETARKRLIPVEQQLLHTGPLEDHAAVAGILAYCQAELQHPDDAAATLAACTSQSGTTTPYWWAAEYFRALAIGNVHSPEAGRTRLRALNADSASRHESVYQMHMLAALLRMGDRDAALELQDICRNGRGSFAHAYGLLAEGVVYDRSDSIAESFRLLAKLGFATFACETGNGLYELLSASQKRSIGRALDLRLVDTPEGESSSQGPADKIQLFGLLTKREQFVAFAAASGMSNSEIADKACVSVRTVEGHLYQIYSKLTIKGRAELHGLAASFATSTAASRV